MIQVRLAWRYLKGRGIRTLLTTLAVVLGVMLMFGMNGVLPSMITALRAGPRTAQSSSASSAPRTASVVKPAAAAPASAPALR